VLSAVAAYRNQQDRKSIGDPGDSSGNTACTHGKTSVIVPFSSC
jgi:hypothetical protein